VARGLWRQRYAEAWRGIRHLGLFFVGVLMGIANLAHDALIALDAIVRTLGRLVTGRHLLEWEPSVKSERVTVDGPRSLSSRLWTLEAVGGLALGAATIAFTSQVALAALFVLWSGSATVSLARAKRPKRVAAPVYPHSGVSS
jgi:cyclic beta-1,2-glucan synthetase